MSDYTPITDFSVKDGLTTGNAEKKILGADFDGEFDAIQTAVATKYDSADLASQVQAEAGASSAVLMTPLRTAQAIAALETSTTLASLGVTSSAAELNILDGVTSTTAELNKLDGVTATTTELNYVDVTTLGTVQASKAVTAAASAINFNNFDMTNVDINSGAIDGTTIGAASAAAAKVTSLSIGGQFDSTVYTANITGSTAIDPANGYVQFLTCTGNVTFTDSVSAGEMVKLYVFTGASSRTAAWPATALSVSAGTSLPTTLTANTVYLFEIIDIASDLLIEANTSWSTV